VIRAQACPRRAFRERRREVRESLRLVQVRGFLAHLAVHLRQREAPRRLRPPLRSISHSDVGRSSSCSAE